MLRKKIRFVLAAFVCLVCFVGKKKNKFNDQPFAYHAELELEIATLTNLGLGLGRVQIRNPQSEIGNYNGWVVMVPFTLPGERVRVRVFRNHKNFSEADLLAVLRPSPDRVTPRCPLFGRCGGCQYQHLSYAAQLTWKRRQVAELLEHMAGIVDFPVAPVVGSPREYHYRSKITPHFQAPRGLPRGSGFGVTSFEPTAPAPHPGPAAQDPERKLQHATEPPTTQDSEPKTQNRAPPVPIGFLRQGTRFDIVDVPYCPIATEGINVKLGAVREAVHARQGDYTRGATLLLREASGEVTTDFDAVVTETIAQSGPPVIQPVAPDAQSEAPPPLRLHFLARDFFQNNPFILPEFTRYVREQAAQSGARFLVDAYCGSGLFALSAASAFERVLGIEISASSVRFAQENAASNDIPNATFTGGDAAAIFAGLEAQFAPSETAVIIDPPRKGCDESFLNQLFAYGPRTVVYVSCDPATQMRDLRHFLTRGYKLIYAQPFDLFPQTRHLECVLTLRRDA